MTAIAFDPGQSEQEKATALVCIEHSPPLIKARPYAVAIVQGELVKSADEDQLTFWSEEPHARLSALPDFGKDLQTLGETSCSHLELLRVILNRPGLSGKTSPVSCHPTEDGTLVPSSGCWGNSGMGSPTGFLTLSTSEWPKDAAVCSLSDTLETGDVPRRFFLSPKACSGILRRAEKRGKDLPEALRAALVQVVDSGQTSTLTEDFKSTTAEDEGGAI